MEPIGRRPQRSYPVESSPARRLCNQVPFLKPDANEDISCGQDGEYEMPAVMYGVAQKASRSGMRSKPYRKSDRLIEFFTDGVFIVLGVVLGLTDDTTPPP